MGLNIAERCHVINLIEPIDITGGAKVSPYVDLRKWSHATVIVTYGVTNADPGDITVEQYNGSLHPDMNFTYYVELTDGGDVLDTGPTATTVAATGLDGSAILGATDHIMVVIEIDSSDLTDGYYAFRVNLGANEGGGTIAAATCILTGGRYAGYGSPTAITT